MKHCAFLFFAFASALVAALPPPVDTSSPDLIRVWGSAELRPLLERWKTAFQKTHPTVRFESRLTGSDVGLPGLYTRLADLALLGRDATAAEVKAFEWIFRYPPARFEVATGSMDAPGRSPALVVYVHRDNPLAQLTLAQLDAAFGCERLRGAPANIRTWGALGLAGEWRDRPIHLYAPDTESGTGRFFRRVVLNDSRALDWACLREFSDTPGVPATHDAGEKILTALSADPLGLAIAGDRPRAGAVKPLAIAATEEGPFIAATRENVIARTYPLARPIFAYVNRAPDTPLDPNLREFIDYVLSADGQREVPRAGVYLPLNDALIRTQRAALK